MTARMRPVASRLAPRQRHWYVTAARGRYARAGNETTLVPLTESHLKRLGHARTACGQSTSNWQVFWLADPVRWPDLCSTCAEAMREGDR